MVLARLIGAAAAAVCLVAGCSNARRYVQPAPRTKQTSPATTTTSTTPLAATTTTIPTQVLATGTTVSPSPEAAVAQALKAYEEAQLACLQDPSACDPGTFVGGAQLEATNTLVSRLRTMGAYARHRTDDPSYWAVDQVTIADDGASAQIRACHWSTDILELAGGVPFNDERVTYHEVVSLANIGGSWIVVEKFGEHRVPETNECGPRP
jgi:hypothetical protein